MPNLPSEEDNRCVVEEDGTRCGAFRLRDSIHCHAHSGALTVANEQRKKKAQKAKELQDELDFNYFPTKTRKDVLELTEKVINGILKGSLRRERAAPLAVFLPFAYKMAKELEGSIPTSTGISIKITETNKSLSVQMDEALMDKYLTSPESVRVQMLEELQQSGKQQKTKRGNSPVIDVVANNITEEDIKVPTSDFASLSNKTDVPLTKRQVTKIFGKTMADSQDMTAPMRGPDMVGFGHVFEKQGLPEGTVHKWKGAYEPDDSTGTAKLWFTCQNCGTKQPNVSREPCIK